MHTMLWLACCVLSLATFVASDLLPLDQKSVVHEANLLVRKSVSVAVSNPFALPTTERNPGVNISVHVSSEIASNYFCDGDHYVFCSFQYCCVDPFHHQ